MNRISLTRIVALPVPALFRWNLSRPAMSWRRQMQKYRRNARSRKQLASLPPHLRRDIGLTDEQIRHETGKRFWQ